MAKINHKPIMLLCAVSLLLSGCASVEGDFPSLSKRSYESDTPIEAANVTAPLTTTLSADLKKTTNGLLARSSAAHVAFEAVLPSARSVAQTASGAAKGSEAWVNAHMMLSRTDSARADGVAALGEIDQLIAREREKGADAGLLALLAIPQRVIADHMLTQNAEIDRLARLIGI